MAGHDRCGILGLDPTDRIAADLRAAGWTEFGFDRVAIHGHARSAAELATAFGTGSPIRQLLADRGTPPDAFIRGLTPRLAALAGGAPCTPELAAVVITAIR
jgi:hypothetical protein